MGQGEYGFVVLNRLYALRADRRITGEERSKKGKRRRDKESDVNSDTDFARFAGKNLDQIFGRLSDLLQGAGR